MFKDIKSPKDFKKYVDKLNEGRSEDYIETITFPED
jgi:hypothetical protein